MYRIDMTITLTLCAPFMTQSSSPGAYGLDSVMARDADDRFIIPGTHVAGKLREAWEELRSAVGEEVVDTVPTWPEINSWLGVKLGDGDYQPQSKKMFFNDFVFTGAVAPSGVRNRIRIDSERGAVDSGALLLVESPFDSGETAFFKGKLRFETDDSSKVALLRGQVLCGFQWLSQIGAFRTIGFGCLDAVAIDEPEIMPVKRVARNWGDAVGFDVVLEPEESFCVAGRPKAGNIFESLEEIPGGVIRGCIAQKVNRLASTAGEIELKTDESRTAETASRGDQPPFQQLRRHFSKVRISHAFPSARCLTRPVRPPLSLIKTDRLYDAAMLESPALINNQAPAFDIDWKEDQDVKALFGWPSLRRELRVRTPIDRKERRYEEKALFAYDMVVPGGRCWLARVDAGDIEEHSRAAVLDDLAALMENGLLGLGKSKVSVKVGVQQPGALKDIFNTRRVDHWMGVDCLLVLTLQTPALMPDPRPLRMRNDGKTLFQAYRSAWGDLAPSLKLRRFFARQFLSGGRYQHGRFQQDGFYQPWLLTHAGSVFVFSVLDFEQARKSVQGWLDHGLGIPPSVLEAYGLPKSDSDNSSELWRHCPFIRQNGYGEIAVNLEVHELKRPPVDQCKPISRLPDEEVTCD